MQRIPGNSRQPSINPNHRRQQLVAFQPYLSICVEPDLSMDRSGVKKFSLILGGGLFCHKNQSCSKLPEMDRSVVKKFSLILERLFCHKNQSCSKLPGMDRSGVKNFSLILGGGFSATKTKVAQNCLKWIDLWSKNFPSSWRGFSATKTKVAQNCLKWIDLVSKNLPHPGEGGGFSATKTKVAGNCLKWIDLVSKNFPHLVGGGGGGGGFCHKNQSCSKLPEMDRSGVKKFPSCSKLPEMDRSGVKKFSFILGRGGGFSATKTKVAQNCLKWIDLVSKIFPYPGGGAFLPQKPKLLKIA